MLQAFGMLYLLTQGDVLDNENSRTGIPAQVILFPEEKIKFCVFTCTDRINQFQPQFCWRGAHIASLKPREPKGSLQCQGQKCQASLI
jgi:hypothetical protein